jgi:hypothetical protein
MKLSEALSTFGDGLVKSIRSHLERKLAPIEDQLERLRMLVEMQRANIVELEQELRMLKDAQSMASITDRPSMRQ